jgi:hypothetical protein
MAGQETGKFRAARIPLDYYKRSDRITRWRWRLVVLALLAAGGFAAATLARGQRGSALVSRGPVAAVHAAWDDNCNACHTSFQPLSGENWLKPVLGGAHANDAKCTTCHAGTTHHAAIKPGDEADCAACHHEHRGRDASLVRVADSDCTRCHGDLAAHDQKSKPEYAAAVTRFDKDHHPDFVPKSDPGKLIFNHKRHMTAGLDCGFTPAKITDAAARKDYAENQDHLVQLDCASCHRTDTTDRAGKDGASGAFPPRSPGAYMLPVRYEAQCAACHPLTVERTNPEDKGSGLFAVPHGLQPKAIHDYLEGHYLTEYLKGNTKLFERPVAVRPFPGKLPPEETEQAGKVVKEKVSAAKKVLYSKNTCLECHHGDPDTGVPETIVAPGVPDVWFKHAGFDHSAHRAVSCQECHAQAYPRADKASTTSADVLIPGRDSCLLCHTPAATASGGARSDCVECHRYHNGDAPLAGVGAAARGVSDPLDMHSFLRGGRSTRHPREPTNP